MPLITLKLEVETQFWLGRQFLIWMPPFLAFSLVFPIQPPALSPLAPCLSPNQNCLPGTSLAVQWLGLSASTAEGTGSIPGQGTKIPYTIWRSQKKSSFKNNNKKQNKTLPSYLSSVVGCKLKAACPAKVTFSLWFFYFWNEKRQHDHQTSFLL